MMRHSIKSETLKAEGLDLARAFRVVRAYRGLSQQVLAKRMTMRPATLSEIETAHQLPGWRTLLRLSKATAVPLSTILQVAAGTLDKPE